MGVTSTVFGYLIAFLLPGMVGLYGLTFWSPAVAELFRTFLTARSNAGLFLLVVLAALVVGLLIAGARWLLYEVAWISLIRRVRAKGCLQGLYARPAPDAYASLGNEKILAAYRAAVEEVFRYYQFWGGMSLVIPLLFTGWLVTMFPRLSWLQIALASAGAAGIECLALIRAWGMYRRFLERERAIISGGGA